MPAMTAIGITPIPRRRLTQDRPQPSTYAPVIGDYKAHYGDPVPDVDQYVYTNDAWQTQHHSNDQRIKLNLQTTVGQQYVLTDIRRGPRVTFLVTNPHAPTREDKVGMYSQDDLSGRIGNARFVDSIPNAYRRDVRMR